ncbi:MAG: Zn-ribbon domain-containing OB-fold protein [Candidatus Thorarchaeota archaeon]
MIKETKITFKKCKKCGFLQYMSHLRCLNCKFDKFELIEASGDCKLISFTILTVPPAEFQYKKSYALGMVEFENGVKALGQITTQNNLKTGMKLKPVYSKICENLNGKETLGYLFEPIL